MPLKKIVEVSSSGFGLEDEKDHTFRSRRLSEIEALIPSISSYEEVESIKVELLKMLDVVSSGAESIDLQLKDAKSDFALTGRRADDRWYRSASYAQKKRKSELRIIHLLLSMLVSRRKSLHGAVKRVHDVQEDPSSFQPPRNEGELRRQKVKALFVVAAWADSIKGLLNLPAPVVSALNLLDELDPGCLRRGEGASSES